MQNQFSSISELTFYIQAIIKQDNRLQNITVEGEISNFTKHSSGNLYFSLKDKETQIKCIMPTRFAMYLRATVKEGDKVEITGDIDVYPQGGYYQLKVYQLKKSGLGELYQEYLWLKEELEKKGLFDKTHKKKIPRFPNHIAIITSATGAAVQDICKTIEKKYPHVLLTIIPTIVQGENGLPSILKSLEIAQTMPNQPDTIILARGGGSIEDLWNFNEEKLAYAIYNCPIPIISGIGHETDSTIADFVADFRAETPTAAAQKAVPDSAKMKTWLQEQFSYLAKETDNSILNKRQLIDDYTNRIENYAYLSVQQTKHDIKHKETALFANLLNYVPTQRQRLATFENELEKNLIQNLNNHKNQLQPLENELDKVLTSNLNTAKNRLLQLENELNQTFLRNFQTLKQNLITQETLLISQINGLFTQKKHHLSLLKEKLESMDIMEVLKQGYTLTLKDGKIIKNPTALLVGDEIQTIFDAHNITSEIKKVADTPLDN